MEIWRRNVPATSFGERPGSDLGTDSHDADDVSFLQLVTAVDVSLGLYYPVRARSEANNASCVPAADRACGTEHAEPTTLGVDVAAG